MADYLDNRAAEINGDQDEDEALRMAIAMSLGRDPADREAGVVDLTQDDDDGSSTADGSDDDIVEIDGLAAVGGSQQTANHTTNPAQAPAPAPAASVLSLLGLDRKKMEEERLARLSKRKASQLEDATQSPPPPSRPTQRPKTEHVPPPSSTAGFGKKKQTEQRSAEPRVAAQSPSLASASASAPRAALLPFPKGVVKKTWAYGQPRQGDDIKIEEVLQKDKLELAVLSSFQWDEQWLLSRVDLTRTKLILIAFAADEAQVRVVLPCPCLVIGLLLIL